MYKIIGADGKEYGPITAEQIRQWVHEGRVNGQTQVLVEGATVWKALSEIPELAAMLPVPTYPAPGTTAPGTISPVPAVPAPISMPMPQASGGVNPLAVTGMVLGILSILFSCCCFGLPWNVAGIVCSAIALSQIKSNPSQEGRGLAIAGLVLSLIGLGLGILLKLLISTTAILHELQKNM